MALSVVKRPRGYHNGTTVNTGTFTNGSDTVTNTSHGLNTEDRIYIYTGQAIGFWRVARVDANTFKITDDGESGTAAARVYTFIGSGTFSYYICVSSSGHFWNAVHLPIVYRLQSTLWPTNSVDTARTVSSFANDNGFVKLTLSGALLSSLSELEFVKITGIGEAGVYQILTWYSTSVVTINMPYYSNLSFGPASVIYYYNNYRAKVRLYAGLAATHPYTTAKPYTLVCEKEIVPDASGYITYNCADDLKAYMSAGLLRNDPNQGTMPLSLDAFTQFYITFAEAYDYSAGGYGLLDFVGSYTSDQSTFEGYAVNASLPFKNVFSGALSTYIYGGTTGTKLKFMTAMAYPVHANNYFDISWANQYGTGMQIYIERYRNGSIFSSGYTSIASNGIGIYRYPITLVSTEDRIDISLYSSGTLISEVKTITVDTSCYFSCIDISWLNYLGGFDYWRFKGFADYGNEITQTIEDKKNILPQWPQSYGEGADTIQREISRSSRATVVLRAENLTADQVNDLYRVKLSPLIQIVNSATDRRTVIPDRSSFTHYPQANKLFTFSFTITYTDENPAQSL